MIISNTDQPEGHQYEEAMASAVRAIGYFTETRTILDHDGREVLQMDVVASPATEAFTSKNAIKGSSCRHGSILNPLKILWQNLHRHTQ